ncbi:MAG: creatininase family protein [bacterium]
MTTTRPPSPRAKRRAAVAAKPRSGRVRATAAAPAAPTKPRLLRWEHVTKDDFDRIDRGEALVLVAVSPLEVHGPHLPLGTDALEAEGLMLRLVELLPERHRERTALALPMVYAAADAVPQPGSLRFSTGTTVRVLTELGTTLAMQGFRNIVVSNFHGSPRHFIALEAACENVNRRHPGTRMVSVFSVLVDRLTGGSAQLERFSDGFTCFTPGDLEGDTHAGVIETGMMLALHAERVSPRYRELPRKTVKEWAARRGFDAGALDPQARAGKTGFRAMLEVWKPNLHYWLHETYAGNPSLATTRNGREVLDTLAAKGAEVVAELLDGKLDPLRAHSPLWPKRFLFLNPWVGRLVEAYFRYPHPIG